MSSFSPQELGVNLYTGSTNARANTVFGVMLLLFGDCN